MKRTSIPRALLLLLVVGSLGVWAWKTWVAPRAPAAAQSGATAARVLSDGVTVINFHGKLRCPTCLRIGSLSQAVVAEQFALEERQGQLAWTSIDFEQPENMHYRDDYDLSSSNVVVVRRSGGRDLGWSRLDEVWTLNDDEAAFRAYVQAALREALEAR